MTVGESQSTDGKSSSDLPPKVQPNEPVAILIPGRDDPSGDMTKGVADLLAEEGQMVKKKDDGTVTITDLVSEDDK